MKKRGSEQSGERSKNKKTPWQGSEQSTDTNEAPMPGGAEQLTDKSVNWEDVAKRALADLDNYKKQELVMQVHRDKLTMYRHATDLARIYSVHRRAMDSVGPLTVNDDKMTKIFKGMLDILLMYNKTLNQWGAEFFDVSQGEAFDPVSMEAISYEESNVGEDKVIDTLEVGVRELSSKEIIKPAKVRVGK